MSTPKSESKQPNWAQRMLRRIVVLSILLLILAFVLPTIIAKTPLKNMLLSRATADLNGSLAVDRMALGWFSNVELDGVTLTDEEGNVVLTADKIETDRSLIGLLRDSTNLGNLTINEPKATIVCEPGSTNIEQVLANYINSDQPEKPTRAAIDVTIHSGTLILKEKGSDVQSTLEAVDGTVSIPAKTADAIAIDLKAGRAETGTIAVEAQLGEAQTITLKGNNFVLATLQPVMTRLQTDVDVEGRLNSDIAVSITPTNTTIKGWARAEEFAVRSSALGEEPLRLAFAEVPVDMDITDNVMTIRQFALTSDVGNAKLEGTLKPEATLAELSRDAHLKLDAEIDLAKLIQTSPQLFQLKPGTQLSEGRMTVHLDRLDDAANAQWKGSVSTTPLRGTRNGQALSWENPLTASFEAKVLPTGLPSFDKLICQTDFIGLSGSGSIDHFIVEANVDLDKLTAHLTQFLEADNFVLQGRAHLKADCKQLSADRYTMTASVNLKQFAWLDAQGQGLREPEMTIQAAAEGYRPPDKPMTLTAGDVLITAQQDQLEAKLLAPMTLSDALQGSMDTKLTGDLTRWHSRLVHVGLPKGWDIGGNGTIAGTLILTPEKIEFQKGKMDIKQARFIAYGINLNDPDFKLDSDVAVDTETNAVMLSNATLSCETAGISTRELLIAPNAKGEWGVQTVAAIKTNLERLQRTVPLGISTPLAGLAEGTVDVTYLDNQVRFKGKIDGKDVRYGPADKPTWQEPWVKIDADGDYDLAQASLLLRKMVASRVGLTTTAEGSVAHIDTIPDLNLSGTLSYDLEKFEPLLREYLGKNANASGVESNAFNITGTLTPSDNRVSMKLDPNSSAADSSLTKLEGNAKLGWDKLSAYGFNVGPATLAANIDKGIVNLSPIQASFSGGEVNLQPTIDLTSDAMKMKLAQGSIIKNATLTPEVFADALGYALPALANAAQAEGLISLDLGENAIPLSDPTKADVNGTLTLHSATVSAGPVITKVAELLGAKNTSYKLANEQKIPIKVKDGRVYHENFGLTIGKSDIKTSGSVGLDGSLQMIVEMPFPERMLDALPPKTPQVVRDALAKRTFKIPVGGTVSDPRLDPQAYTTETTGLFNGAIREAARDKAAEFLDKGRDKLFDELRKKLEPKK